MGLFDKLLGNNNSNKLHDLTALKELYKSINSFDGNKYNFILEEIEKFECGTSTFFLREEHEFVEFMTTIILSMESYTIDKLENLFKEAKDIYNFLCPFKNETENYNQLFKLFLTMFQSDSIYIKDMFSKELFTIFYDKKNYIDVMNIILTTKGIDKTHLSKIEEFITKASTLTASESILKAQIISFVRDIPICGNIDELIEKKISDLEKYAGIYHIDKYLLAELDAKINGAESIFSRLDKLTISINEELALIESEISKAGDSFERVKKDKLFELRSTIEEYNTRLKLAHNDLLREAKRALASEKDELLHEFEVKLAGYQKVLDDFGVNAEATIKRVVEEMRENGASITSELSSLMNSPEIKELIEGLKSNPDFVKSIGSKVALTGVPTEGTVAVPAITPVVAVPEIIIPEKTGIIPALDMSIPFSERYKMVMEAKRRDIEENGSVYHEKTDDIIAMLLSNSGVTPYLYGPSQCGKTYSVNQICKLIGLPTREIGKIIEEYNVLGYKTATGSYSRTNFRDSYECGYAAFIDEIDSGDQNATLILNEFLGKGDGSSYSFPDGVIYRHPNFRTIAAGNTDGNGANFAYSSRHKLDESILQRLTPIYFGYDKQIEESATKGIEEWLEFTYAFREALDKVNGNSIGTGRNANVILGNVTTKDLYVIREWILNKQFGSSTIDKTIEYQFIGSQNEKTLASLVEAMSSYYSTPKDSSELYKRFSMRCEEIRKRGR